jgi:hypothetical protein
MISHLELVDLNYDLLFFDDMNPCVHEEWMDEWEIERISQNASVTSASDCRCNCSKSGGKTMISSHPNEMIAE